METTATIDPEYNTSHEELASWERRRSLQELQEFVERRLSHVSLADVEIDEQV